ncbi:PREDICTED: NADPH--cytochrome P450 reductase-like [Acropora digitifera]|uniref:NADPH--cytochrome P450 reductase-like n=1 Tax=Acropora digitifera TaxID=70779 RepID=UPI00077A0B7F|nr:PREDICTED: NADPH--cytochrome P450 reductase-like [Acropora digitifera]
MEVWALKLLNLLATLKLIYDKYYSINIVLVYILKEELTRMGEIENSMAIFVVATYGEGDPTDNAQEFYEWLQNDRDDLDCLHYTVFALGNKTYEHYNAMGRFVDKRLEEMGGKRIFEKGEGDDDAKPFDAKNPFLAPVLVNRELHRAGDRSCMHIELDITGSKIKYEAGDHVGVYATNDPELVEKLGSILNVDLDTVISLKNTDEDSPKKNPFPCPTTYRTALLHYVDIASTVKTHVLRELAEYATDAEDRQFLLNITDSTEEAKKKYHNWISQPHRHIVAVLEDLSSLRPSLDHILELLPRLQCRYYSISSSPKMYPTSIHITAVLVRWTTATGRVQKGVATTWLATKMPTGMKSLIALSSKHFHTYLFYTIYTYIYSLGRPENNVWCKQIGNTVLFFGCRKKSEDYIYEDELTSYEGNGTLTDLHVAFSRDQEQKVYVTNHIAENKDSIWQILDGGGHVYVCGDARNMARDVHNSLVTIVKEKAEITEKEATDYVKRLSAKGRYSVDVWS